jgi:hypothetical protein
MKYVSITLVLLLALAMGCSSMEGRRIDGSKTKNLIADDTAPADVVKMFGEPQQKEDLASGETKYVYYYRANQRILFFRTGGQVQDQERLEVFFKNNQVDRYRFMDTEQAPVTTDIPPMRPATK